MVKNGKIRCKGRDSERSKNGHFVLDVRTSATGMANWSFLVKNWIKNEPIFGGSDPSIAHFAKIS